MRDTEQPQRLPYNLATGAFPRSNATHNMKHSFDGLWTQTKLDMLGRYLVAFNTAGATMLNA